jgi:hypothetical protein
MKGEEVGGDRTDSRFVQNNFLKLKAGNLKSKKVIFLDLYLLSIFI